MTRSPSHPSDFTRDTIAVEPLALWHTEAQLVQAFIEGAEWMRGDRVLNPIRMAKLAGLYTAARSETVWPDEVSPKLGADVVPDEKRLERSFLRGFHARLDWETESFHDWETGTIGFDAESLLGLIYLALYEEHHAGRPLWRKCLWCGEFFELRNDGKIVCGDRCGNARNYYNRTQRRAA